MEFCIGKGTESLFLSRKPSFSLLNHIWTTGFILYNTVQKDLW